MGRDELKRALGTGASGRAGRRCRRRPRRRRPTARRQPRRSPPPSRSCRPTFASSTCPRTRACHEFVPVLYGAARVHYTDTKRGIDTVRGSARDRAVHRRRRADRLGTRRAVRRRRPTIWPAAPPTADPTVAYRALPPAGLDAKRYTAWTKDFEQWVLRAERLMLYAAPALKLTSQRRRERARLPPARAAGAARVARRGRAEAARQVRAQGGAADPASAIGRRCRGPRRAAGVAAEDADDGVGGRHRARRAVRPQGRLALDAWGAPPPRSAASAARSRRRRTSPARRSGGRRPSAS